MDDLVARSIGWKRLAGKSQENGRRRCDPGQHVADPGGEMVLFLASFFFVLAIVPYRWTEELSGKQLWYLLLFLIAAPLAVALLNMSAIIPSQNALFTLQIPDSANIVVAQDTNEPTTVTRIVKMMLTVFWLVLPIRILISMIQGITGSGFLSALK